MSDLMGRVPVSRHELDLDQASSRVSTPDSALEARFRKRLQAAYEAPVSDTTSLDGVITLEAISAKPENLENDDGEEEYEFRLFGSTQGKSANVASTPQRVGIRSPTPISRDAGFVVARRPDRYYFSGSLDMAQKKQIDEAAVLGEDVLNGANLKWRGCELPWRVTVIKSAQVKRNPSLERVGGPSAGNFKKRIGKKRRIAIRKKMEVIKNRKASAKQIKAEKEAAEKEKRTRKNREKKVKKKQKEKLKKLKKAGETQAAD